VNTAQTSGAGEAGSASGATPGPATHRPAGSGPAPGGQRLRRRPGARAIRPKQPVVLGEDTAYVGLVARAIAFVIDALIINGIAAIVTAGLAIALSVLVSDPSLSPPGVAAGAAVFALWSTSYFVIGWSVGGQTIGDAVMGFRVVDARSGLPLRPCRALARFAALSLGAIPFLAGLWILLWDRRRRAFHDRVVRSVVVRVDREAEPPAPVRPTAEPIN
jgi:uncharacterized RDD family membrane protein YckC